MLTLENVSFYRNQRGILERTNWTIEKGKVVGIIGESGAGKTTLLKLMSGLLDAHEGIIALNGERIIGPSVKLVPGYEEIQLVNQDFALDRYHTVEENIREKVLHLPQKMRDEIVNEMLELVELTALKNQQALNISGGEQQRLALARALACEPSVLLLDEPFVHLDQRLRMKVMRYLKSLTSIQGVTVVLVSHDGAEMLGFVNEIAYLNAAKLQLYADVNAFYFNPMDARQGQLLGPINEINHNGKALIFRPNAFRKVNTGGISVRFKEAWDNGIIVYNYFGTENNEEIVLTDSEILSEVTHIEIVRKP